TLTPVALMRTLSLLTLLLAALAAARAPARAAEDDGWIDLSSGPKALDAWQAPTGAWFLAGNARMDPNDPRHLVGEPGEGVLINGPKGNTRNLLTRQKFTDLEVRLDFLIPRRSNSGVKLMGLYEIQIFDSYGVKEKNLTGADCGGIYPRAELGPKYHHIDKGVPPRVNAARPAGEWQTLDIVFQAPRFDAAGKKTRNARFVRVVLNDQVIHENVEVEYPTGHAWHNKEIPAGPVLLQADHGPVAFRHIRIRPAAHAAGKE
ncbi:MAG TPA: DUF1080 domain-containing protein, partial [Gemmataceae bacterium]|nr:DUF1080 domain-containing protein [Gemmataceae bacterium]